MTANLFIINSSWKKHFIYKNTYNHQYLNIQKKDILVTKVVKTSIRDYPCTKYFEKLTFIAPWYAHLRVHIRRQKMLVISKNFAYVINGWPIMENDLIQRCELIEKLRSDKFAVLIHNSIWFLRIQR